MSDRNTFQPGDALRQTLGDLTAQAELLKSRMNWPSSVQDGPAGPGGTNYADFVWLYDPRSYWTLSTIDLDPGRWILVANVSWRSACSTCYRVGGGLRINAVGVNRDADATQEAASGGGDMRYTSRVALEVTATDRFTATLSMWGGGAWTVAPAYTSRFIENYDVSFLAYPG